MITLRQSLPEQLENIFWDNDLWALWGLAVRRRSSAPSHLTVLGDRQISVNLSGAQLEAIAGDLPARIDGERVQQK